LIVSNGRMYFAVEVRLGKLGFIQEEILETCEAPRIFPSDS